MLNLYFLFRICLTDRANDIIKEMDSYHNRSL